MRRLDDAPLDPEMIAILEAIDATLDGQAVDPSHAELAELALLLRSERPETPSEFADELDDRVRHRFAAPVPAGRLGAPGRRPPGRRRAWVWAPAGGLAAALAVAVVIVTAGGSSGRPSSQTLTAASSAQSAKVASPSSGVVRSAASSAGAAATTPHAAPTPERLSTNSAALGLSSAAGVAAQLDARALQPPANGRRIIQGAQLALTASAARLEQVAQEVFDVAGRENAIVQSSNVTAAAGGGYAEFQLGIPSGSLPQAMAALSSLPFAHVAARTDSTQDVNNRYLADVRALAAARALRTSLLKPLAAATTQAQIGSLTARIHDAEASISSDEATLNGLRHQIGLSQVAVTINSGPVPVPLGQTHHGGGFTLSRAVHDAGRVLTVAAGVALIAAAAMLPLGLVAALVWWAAVVVRRRRREQALDLV